jgi:hypothetical protein
MAGGTAGAALAAGLADKPRLKIGQPEVIGPLICADRTRMAATKVLAIDEDAAHARVAHLAQHVFPKAS